jgi:cytochrome c peroxidase
MKFPFTIRSDRYGLRPLLGIVLVAAIAMGVASRMGTPRKVQAVEAMASQAAESDEPIQPIRPLAGLDRRKIDLGRKLFNDRRLSHNDQVSCSSCHNLATGGTDRKARSIGIDGAIGVINAPTVFNSGFNFSQFWDGRVDTLENQVDGPILSAIELGSSWPEVITKLRSDPEYAQTFGRIYRETVQAGDVKNSLAEFERSLATPNSRFDRYLRHEPNALTDRERQGYALFTSFGCVSCHQGVNMGGNMYQKLGVMAPYFADRGQIGITDRGRFNVTGDARDLYMFKFPSLRNVDLTPPYFHDGSQATLPNAVRTMAKYQLGRLLADSEVESIVEFLKTLTGEWNGKAL